MEFLTILISGLLGLVTPAGLFVDKTIENAIRSELKSVGELQVRVDNVPTHRLLQGKIQRLRVAGRSLVLKSENIRISLLEIETDEIALNTTNFRLRKPLTAVFRVVMTQKDINNLLNSSEFVSQLRKIDLINSVNSSSNRKKDVYNLTEIQAKILEDSRLQLQLKLAQRTGEQTLSVKVESGLSVISGRQIKLINPTVALNEEVAPKQFLDLVINNLNQQLDLRKLEDQGVQMRILKLDTKDELIEIAAFVRIQPSSNFLTINQPKKHQPETLGLFKLVNTTNCFPQV
ncbi:MAG: DUF2993 domain-containing protein [Mastigocoleus sp.]